jgi:signal peptidase I
MDKGIYSEIIEWIKAIIIAGIIAFIINTFVFSLVYVDGTSMNPTLKDAERLVLNKTAYLFKGPEHGDIVVFHANSFDDYIKRVIALPGETVEMRQDQLYINGQVVDEPYLDELRASLNGKGMVLTEDFGPITVRDGYLFVLGDNRRNSTDSRLLGSISKTEMSGKVSIRVWPLNAIGKVDK